mmetsp:Transcript_32777/g.52757  ORF Transcript_32777/g.52757 Transcript_32777/m.52757 type:complete len:261 (+) Transcript_32777:3-785(+)
MLFGRRSGGTQLTLVLPSLLFHASAAVAPARATHIIPALRVRRLSAVASVLAPGASSCSHTMASHGEETTPGPNVSILTRRGYRPGDKVLLYDGVCNLCNGWVNFVLDRDPNSRYKFAALQGEAGKAMMKRVGKDPDDLSTLVLVEWQLQDTAQQPQRVPMLQESGPSEIVYIKSEAVLRVVEDIGGAVLGRAAYIVRKVIPRVVRDFVYSNCVAPNRYLIFGKDATCRRITPALKPRFLDLDQVVVVNEGDAGPEGRGR